MLLKRFVTQSSVLRKKVLLHVDRLRYDISSRSRMYATVSATSKVDISVMERFEVTKSANDKSREYRGVKLANGMRVLLTSDPTTDKSAAALDVNVGHMSDPKEIPGLAHFCEHMLFMGTEKYPVENDYSKYLSEHGGSSNACTYADHTKYYFDVTPDHFRNVLDRFAQFFISPLFTESATEREMNAVDLEHEKNIPNDAWRMHQLDKHLCDPNHPYHNFGSGTKQTLGVIPKENGLDIRGELLKFHDKWYSSNIMALAVLGKESLDELEEMVVELFNDVKNKNIVAPTWTDHPFTDEYLRRLIKVVPIKDIRNLNIKFPMPCLHKYYKSGPGHYLSHLIGHEGENSLLALLKSKGWSNSLVAGERCDARGFSFFAVSMDLTEDGLSHIDDVVELFFQYINMLKSHGPKLWIFNESKDILAMHFRFKDKELPQSFVSNVVHNLHEYPLPEVISCGYLLSEWKPHLIDMVTELIVPQSIQISVTAKQYEAEANAVEPWYGTKHKVEKLSTEQIRRWKSVGLNEMLELPTKNEFIPTQFDILPRDVPISKHPEIIHDCAFMRVWFKQDDEFLLPKANLNFEFVSPLSYLDPLSHNLTYMFVQLFRDSINEYTYSADLAGLKWDLSNTKNGMVLSVGGYNEKQDVFLHKVIDKITSFEVDSKRFEILKENYIRSLKNFKAEQPYQHAVYYLALLLTENAWTKDEFLNVMDLVTVSNLEAFIGQLLAKVHIECLIHGNVNKQKALELSAIVLDALQKNYTLTSLLPAQLVLNREIKLADGCTFLYEIENTIHRSSCTELYYQCGVQHTQKNILLELFLQIIAEPFFNILRTKEQLGYIVFSGMRRSNGVQGVRIIVQSDKHPSFVDQRVEEFFSHIADILEEMSDEEFERYKEALAAQRLEKPKGLSVLTLRFWSEISSQQYNFDRANIEVNYLRTVTKENIKHFFKKYIERGSETRNKMAVYIVSNMDSADKQDVEKVELHYEQITDITVFKTTQAMFPLVQPYLNIPRKGNKSKL